MPTFIAIDLKSFYASVECVERGLDPLGVNLVVADRNRTDKTICLAVTPTLKAYGIGGRARLFEVVSRVREINRERLAHAPEGRFRGKSAIDSELKDPSLMLDYIVAPPRMAHYMKVSTQIYGIYLKYIAPEDIHVYSIDEVFIDVTAYLKTYGKTAHELAMTMIRDVLQQTGITATAGIGTNMYLAKVAMDIVAKHIPADKDGVRIGELDERSYRDLLWNHRPLTSFWRIGRGTASRLERFGVDTMGKLARLSLENEELLYGTFGVNAELLIDHAWGWEPCTMEAVKSYVPEDCSLCSGQVLQKPYTAKMAKVVVMEMADAAAMRLLDNGLVTDQIVLTVSYDVSNVLNGDGNMVETVKDRYGRRVPVQSHGSINMNEPTSSAKELMGKTAELFERIVNPSLLVRRLNLTTNHVMPEMLATTNPQPIQLDLFEDNEEKQRRRKQLQQEKIKERRLDKARLAIRKRFGKNALFKGLNLAEGATAKERNSQIGGHKA